MTIKFVSPNLRAPESALLHVEEYGIPRVARETAEFIERRFREINAGDPQVDTKELCGGCVTSVMLNLAALLGLKTNWGPESLLKNILLGLEEETDLLDQASELGMNTDELIRERFLKLEQTEASPELLSRLRFARLVRSLKGALDSQVVEVQARINA